MAVSTNAEGVPLVRVLLANVPTVYAPHWNPLASSEASIIEEVDCCCAGRLSSCEEEVGLFRLLR